ncbi:site-specific integrase [Paenibacillus sp. CC-CFT747]|nr:site-specific integrase [Paenibacillus sp. CC-CFT747]
MIQRALRRGRTDIAMMIQLGVRLGLRIHEVVRLSRGDVERAMRGNELTVKGKGGLIRQVPFGNEMIALLKSLIAEVPRGHKVFVPIDSKAHEVIRSVQAFIIQHRDRVEVKGSRPAGVTLTYHGLRHLYAYERYKEFLSQGFSESTAKIKVAHLIGHSREDVTRIYLAEGEKENG